jgi:hypothetical protein
MIQLHPNILRKDGKEEFVVLPYTEFVAIQEMLEDVEDLLELQAAKQAEADAPLLSYDDVKQRYDATHV